MSTELKKLAFEDHFLHKRRRSSHHNYGKEVMMMAKAKPSEDVSHMPPAIQVWADDDISRSCERRKSADDEEDLQLTPKAVVGPMFLMPDIAVPTQATVENIEKAMAENGASGYLQVPFAVPRRRHSWICG